MPDEESRLDRVERVLEETANIANSNARVIQAIASAMAEFQEDRQQMLGDIRGLQTENRRILEHMENTDRRLQELEGRNDQ